MLLPICADTASEAGTAAVRLPKSTCKGRRSAARALAVIEYVLCISGSDGLMAMAGVCAACAPPCWTAPRRHSRSLKLFRCRRIQAVGQDYLLTNLREHRVSIFDEDFYISPVAQSRLFLPKPWPPTSMTAEAFARALFEPFPGLLFVRRMPAVPCDRSLDRIYTWRAAKGAVVDVVSPLFPRWLVPLSSRRQYTGKEQYWLPYVVPMAPIFDEAGENYAVAAEGNARLWEFCLSEPVPEVHDTQPPKLENRLVFSFQGRSQQVPRGSFPPDTTALAS